MFLIPWKNKKDSQNALAPVGFGDFDRMLEEFFSAPLSQMFRTAPLRAVEQSWTPSLDIKETDKEYILTADLPGVEPEKLDVTTHDGVLTISAERAVESKPDEDGSNGYIWRERSYGATRRTLRLPDNADEAKVHADYKNGILTVTLPKKEGSGGRKIDVRQS